MPGFMAAWSQRLIRTTGVFSSPLLFHSRAPGSSRAPAPLLPSQQPAHHGPQRSVQGDATPQFFAAFWSLEQTRSPFPSRTCSCSPQRPRGQRLTGYQAADKGLVWPGAWSPAPWLPAEILVDAPGRAGQETAARTAVAGGRIGRSRAKAGPQEAELPSAGSSSRPCLGRSSAMSSPFPAARGTRPEEGTGGGQPSSCQLALPQQKAAPGSWPTLH